MKNDLVSLGIVVRVKPKIYLPALTQVTRPYTTAPLFVRLRSFSLSSSSFLLLSASLHLREVLWPLLSSWFLSAFAAAALSSFQTRLSSRCMPLGFPSSSSSSSSAPLFPVPSLFLSCSKLSSSFSLSVRTYSRPVRLDGETASERSSAWREGAFLSFLLLRAHRTWDVGVYTGAISSGELFACSEQDGCSSVST